MWLESNVSRLMFGIGTLIAMGIIYAIIAPRWDEFVQVIHHLITRRSMFVE